MYAPEDGEVRALPLLWIHLLQPPRSPHSAGAQGFWGILQGPSSTGESLSWCCQGSLWAHQHHELDGEPSLGLGSSEPAFGLGPVLAAALVSAGQHCPLLTSLQPPGTSQKASLRGKLFVKGLVSSPDRENQ